MQSYLTVTAPFDGMITTRYVHEGSLVSPQADGSPMVRIEEFVAFAPCHSGARNCCGRCEAGHTKSTYSACFPGQKFSGLVARISQALDQKTRTMPIEFERS